jgi:hypothetical protein
MGGFLSADFKTELTMEVEVINYVFWKSSELGKLVIVLIQVASSFCSYGRCENEN